MTVLLIRMDKQFKPPLQNTPKIQPPPVVAPQPAPPPPIPEPPVSLLFLLDD